MDGTTSGERERSWRREGMEKREREREKGREAAKEESWKIFSSWARLFATLKSLGCASALRTEHPANSIY